MDNSDYEKVTFVYVHGIITRDPSDFEENVKKLHGYFKDKRLGKYIISDQYEVVNWRELLLQDVPLKLFEDGLIRINTDHNRLKIKRTSKPNIFLAIRPIYKLLQFSEKGSNPNAVYARNKLQNYIFNLFWLSAQAGRRDRVFDRIQEKINNINGKFVILAHSLGTPIAVRFIWERIILDSDKNKVPSNKENFVGLITTGDINNTVMASTWADQVLAKDYESKKPDFIKYTIDNNKFWIVYNHRNDIIATGLAHTITSFNDRGPGFISYNTNKSTLLGDIISFLKFWDRSNGTILSHSWLFNKPAEFSKCVLEAYNKNKKL